MKYEFPNPSTPNHIIYLEWVIHILYKECLGTLHGILCSVTLCGNHDGWSFALNSIKAHSQAHTTANSPLVIG